MSYLDCDVEEPNGHLFLKPEIQQEEQVTLTAPIGADEDKCIACGKCVDACSYNAIALVKEKILFFPELCKAYSLLGADIIICISASPSVTRKYFEALLPARAIENTTFMIYSSQKYVKHIHY